MTQTNWPIRTLINTWCHSNRGDGTQLSQKKWRSHSMILTHCTWHLVGKLIHLSQLSQQWRHVCAYFCYEFQCVFFVSHQFERVFVDSRQKQLRLQIKPQLS